MDAELSHSDGRTDRQTDRHDEATFANAHKRGYSVVVVSGITFVSSSMKNVYLEVGYVRLDSMGPKPFLLYFLSFSFVFPPF